MTKFIDVATGEVKVSAEPSTLRALALGSCIAVIVYDRKKRIGGLAHIMLPGRSPSSESMKTKYTEDAVDILLDAVRNLGAEPEAMEASLVGGANMLEEGDLPEKLAESVLTYLKKLGVKPKKMKLGGNKRRSVFLDIGTGKMFYTVGNSKTMSL